MIRPGGSAVSWCVTDAGTLGARLAARLGATSGAIVAALAAMIGACDPPVFFCDIDVDCDDGRRRGVCEPDGYCSFVDESCPTGRAYGEHAPAGRSRRCTLPNGAHGSSDDGGIADGGSDDSDAVEPRRAEGPAGEAGDDEGESTGDGGTSSDASSGEPPVIATCDDGERNGDETDVDCGGPCSPCALCRGCVDDDDCVAGSSCKDAACRVHAELVADWTTHCDADGEFEVSVVVPPGLYRLSATPSAGSKWPTDGGNGGHTWAWWLDCEEVEVSNMRTPEHEWYATAAIAYDALALPTEAVLLEAGTLSCGVIDSNCGDNRGEVKAELENLCP